MRRCLWQGRPIWTSALPADAATSGNFMQNCSLRRMCLEVPATLLEIPKTMARPQTVT